MAYTDSTELHVNCNQMINVLQHCMIELDQRVHCLPRGPLPPSQPLITCHCSTQLGREFNITIFGVREINIPRTLCRLQYVPDCI